jgi:hypothetical protein
MQRMGKLILIGFAVVVVCVGLGFAWGVSGRGELQTALDETRQRLDLAEARGRILDARVNLYNNNFGDASRNFEEAKLVLQRVRDRYAEDGSREAATGIGSALERLDEAQRLAGKLDPAANSKASEALEAVRVATGS